MHCWLAACSAPYEAGRAHVTEPPVKAVPAEGWTAAELAGVFVIDNVPVSCPMTLRDFGTDYTYVPYSFDSAGGMSWCAIESADNYLAQVYLGDTTIDELTADTEITGFLINGRELIDSPENEYGEENWLTRDIYLNGVTFGASPEEVKAALGEPSYYYDSRENPDNETGLQIIRMLYDSPEGGSILALDFNIGGSGNMCLSTINFDFDGNNEWKYNHHFAAGKNEENS